MRLQSHDGSSLLRHHWLWVAGETLSKLVEWLKAGSTERETGLLKALAQAPIPKKLPPAEGATHLWLLDCCNM